MNSSLCARGIGTEAYQFVVYAWFPGAAQTRLLFISPRKRSDFRSSLRAGLLWHGFKKQPNLGMKIATFNVIWYSVNGGLCSVWTSWVENMEIAPFIMF